MSMKSVLAEELGRISLSREEQKSLERVSGDFIVSLKRAGIKAYVGGSLAKGTMIQRVSLSESDVRCQMSDVRRERKQDVDIFVVFNYSEDIVQLEKVLKKIDLPGVLKKVHGSRDYFQIICPSKDDPSGPDGIILEVIPVVKNRDPEIAENVTDVSLSHVKYVVGEVRKSPGIADEVKLAKAFCQAQRCYGAESYVKGFSGYSLEVLVIHFGGFVKFLRGIGKKRVIDPLKYFKGEREVLNELNASKLQGPLVLIDPTYKYRNVSAGLGAESFEKFLKVKDEFLRSPSLEYFERRPIDVEGMKALCASGCRSSGCRGVGKARFVEIDLATDRQEGDIAGTKMKKLLDFFVRELVRKQQVVVRKEFDYVGGQKAKGYLVVAEKGEIEVRGPSMGLEGAVKAFRKAKGSRAFERNKFWWYKEKVSIKGVFEFVKKVMGEMGASGKLVLN